METKDIVLQLMFLGYTHVFGKPDLLVKLVGYSLFVFKKDETKLYQYFKGHDGKIHIFSSVDLENYVTDTTIRIAIKNFECQYHPIYHYSSFEDLNLESTDYGL